LNSITHLARIRVLRGHLQQGMATYNLAEQAMPFVPGQRVHVIHPGYYFGVADILRELNRLPEAAEQAAHGMELTRGSLSVDADVLTLGYAVLARVHCALGDFESALAMLDEFAERAAARQFIVELVAQVTALRALIELQRNNLAAAVQWADASGISPNTPPNFFREPEYLTWARVRIAQAQSRLYPAEQVIAFLTRLRADAQANERISSVIEILVLTALANSAAENWAAASLALSDALSLAAPEGYLRVFLDAGPVLAEILKGLARQAAPPIQPYLHRLLTAFGISIPLPLSIVHSPNTPDDLSAREIQVLELVAQGASNQEIAARLIVAVGTVKKHINNIYSKLGVNSRTQAVARGRARKLIP
jgi:LuxR family maltose regulon positive regulatory protein